MAGVGGEVVAAAWGGGRGVSEGCGREKVGGGVPWNQIINFSVDGLPSQYAFVPSGRVTSLGVKPRSLANAGYASSMSGVRYL